MRYNAAVKVVPVVVNIFLVLQCFSAIRFLRTFENVGGTLKIKTDKPFFLFTEIWSADL